MLPGRMAKSVKLGRSPTADWTDVPHRPYEGPSPDLPKLGRGKKWAEPVVLFWETVRRMPHCILWEPTDWQYALEVCYLKQAFWNEYAEGEIRSTLATEMRRREDNMGTTVEARRKLRIRYIDDEGTDVEAGPEGGSITDLAARRRRLAG